MDSKSYLNSQRLAQLLSKNGFELLSKQPKFGVLFLDSLSSGMYTWTRPLNLTMLRTISHGIDTCRSNSNAPIRQGGFLLYLAYILYPPLYIAGPILTFDSFATQMGIPSPPGCAALGLKKLFRTLCYAIFLEVALHWFYYHSISHNLKIILHQYPKRDFWIPPWEMMMLGLWVLVFIYLKFLVIWRASASIALLDGIDTPENIKRCVCNNYTFRGFWRCWHSSLHEWVVKYMYVPLGGRRTQTATVWVIFLFIGAWHDLEMR